jgi:hypothetical protein
MATLGEVRNSRVFHKGAQRGQIAMDGCGGWDRGRQKK